MIHTDGRVIVEELGGVVGGKIIIRTQYVSLFALKVQQIGKTNNYLEGVKIIKITKNFLNKYFNISYKNNIIITLNYIV